MLKSYSHDNLRKGRYVKATKRPFFPRLAAGARLSVRRASAGSGPKPTTWSLTATSPKTNITIKTTVTKTTLPASSRQRAATATVATIPKPADNNWIAASLSFSFLEQRSWLPHNAAKAPFKRDRGRHECGYYRTLQPSTKSIS